MAAIYTLTLLLIPWCIIYHHDDGGERRQLNERSGEKDGNEMGNPKQRGYHLKIEAKRDVRDADMQTNVNSHTLLPSKDQWLALRDPPLLVLLLNH